MGFPTILYCGRDECLRVPVLQVAGLRVAQCASPEELERQLRDEPEIAAILFEEARDQTADAAAQMAKGSSAAALVLFRHPAGNLVVRAHVGLRLGEASTYPRAG